MAHRLYEKDVENATNNYGNEPDWGKVVEVCGRIQNSMGTVAIKGAITAVVARAKHSEERVKLQALALLESCVTNCGKSFRAEMTDQQSLNDLRDMAKGVGCSGNVATRMRGMLASWCVEFGSEPAFSGVVQLKASLQGQGVQFPAVRAPAPAPSPTPSQQQEDSDLTRAIQLSLREQATTSSSSTAASVYPSLSSPASQPVVRSPASTGKKCRALFDFTAAEDNELSFKSGEVIEVLDDRDKHWWKGKSPIGEGLFPSNFVTMDLSTDPSVKRSEDLKKAKERAKRASASAKPKQINLEVIEVCLDMLRSADTTTGNKEESATQKEMEGQCRTMRPMVEKNILSLERDGTELQQLNEDYQQAITVYRQLLSAGVTSSAHAQAPPTSLGGQPYAMGGLPQVTPPLTLPPQQQQWASQPAVPQPSYPGVPPTQGYSYQLPQPGPSQLPVQPAAYPYAHPTAQPPYH